MKTVWTFEREINGSLFTVYVHFTGQQLFLKRCKSLLEGDNGKPWLDWLQNEILPQVRKESTAQQLAWMTEKFIEFYE